MNVINIIEKKKKNIVLSNEELKFIVEGYIDGSVTDYQMSAFLMAVCIHGLSDVETFELTRLYVESGYVVDFDGKFKHVADKHSTGGVGDNTSLIIGPLVASCGVAMAKMSGRGLGHTGGTVDKLESIDGFKIELSEEEFTANVINHNLSIIGQSKDLVIADKKIYALRDVTGTVDSIPLIAASIMSKKIASGSDTILIDVKVGRGAILKEYKESVALAEMMVKIGEAHNKKTRVILSEMDYPLGLSVGNKLEVIEALKFLQGEHASDLYELCIAISANLVSLCLEITYEEAEQMVIDNLESGKAFEYFKTFIEAQGGDFASIEKEYNQVDVKEKIEIVSDCNGYIIDIDALHVANLVRDTGAGRLTKADEIDYNVGVVLNKKINDYVEKGDVLCTLYLNEKGVQNICENIKSAYQFSSEVNNNVKVIHNII